MNAIPDDATMPAAAAAADTLWDLTDAGWRLSLDWIDDQRVIWQPWLDLQQAWLQQWLEIGFATLAPYGVRGMEQLA